MFVWIREQYAPAQESEGERKEKVNALQWSEEEISTKMNINLIYVSESPIKELYTTGAPIISRSIISSFSPR